MWPVREAHTLHGLRKPKDLGSKPIQELCEGWGGRPGLPSLIIRTVRVDEKQELKKKGESQSSGAV